MVFEKVSYEAASEEVKAIYDETMKEMNIPIIFFIIIPLHLVMLATYY